MKFGVVFGRNSAPRPSYDPPLGQNHSLKSEVSPTFLNISGAWTLNSAVKLQCLRTFPQKEQKITTVKLSS